MQTTTRKQNSNKATQSCNTIISKLGQKSTSEKKCEQNSLNEIFEDSPINISFNSPSFSGFDGFELIKLIVGGCDKIAIGVNNSFSNNKSLNDDVVNNKFVNSTAMHNEIAHNNSGDSLKNKFLNKIFPIGGYALSDSVKTENTSLKVSAILPITVMTLALLWTIHLCQQKAPLMQMTSTLCQPNAPSLKTYLKHKILDFPD